MGTIGRPPRPIADRLWARVEKTDGCWLWTGAKNRSGYGRIQQGVGITLFVHRVAYELVVGPIPKGWTIDHLCRVHACVRPAHLEAVTPRVNVLRGQTIVARNAAKTHCHRGHPFTEANTYRFGPNGRYRSCRECGRFNQSGLAERVHRYVPRQKLITAKR